MTEVIAQWRPDLGVFLRRCAWVSAATLVLFAIAGLLTGFWQILYAAPVLIIAYSFLFDDHLRWRAARHNQWELTSQALIHHGYEGTGQVALSEIADAFTRFGWTVIVKLRSGQRVEMAYVRTPQQIADRILAARNALGTAPDQKDHP